MDTPKDLENIKKKLLEQIGSQYGPDKAKEYTEKINSMTDEQFVGFLKQQGLIAGEGGEPQQCIFCALASGAMPRTPIGENQKAIAILELNPISKGHSLILPKEHIASKGELPTEANELAEKVKADLIRAFNPQRVDLVPGNIMGHEIINILPVYNNETINSDKTQETPEGLAAIKKEIEDSVVQVIEEKKPEVIEEKKESAALDEEDWIPKRPRP